MDLKSIKTLINKNGGKLIAYSLKDLTGYNSVIKNNDICEYLLECQTENSYQASGIYIGGDEKVMRRANFEFAPGVFLFPYNFLSIASDIGGNEICVHSITGNVYFASHSAFDEDYVYYTNEETGQLIDIPGLNYKNILKGLVFLDNNFEKFLIDLLNNRLTDKLEQLDN